MLDTLIISTFLFSGISRRDDAMVCPESHDECRSLCKSNGFINGLCVEGEDDQCACIDGGDEGIEGRLKISKNIFKVLKGAGKHFGEGVLQELGAFAADKAIQLLKGKEPSAEGTEVMGQRAGGRGQGA